MWSDIILLMLKLVLPMALGLLSRLFRLVPENGSEVLRTFVVRVCMPLLVFQNLYDAKVDSLPQFFPAAAAFVVLTLLYTITGVAAARLFFNDRKLKNAYFIAVFMGNYGFLGWGVMHSFYGPEAFTRSVFFSIPFWPVFLTVGFVALLGMNNCNKPGIGAMWRMVVVNAAAPVLAAALGVVLNLGGVGVPGPLAEVIRGFASMAVPLILFTVGLGLSFKMKPGQWKMLGLAAIHRLILGFALGLVTWKLISFLLPVDAFTARVILMEAVMPTAAMSPFFTLYFETEKEMLDTVIAGTTILAIATLVLWYPVVEWLL